jgi:hypothetical protein
MDSTELEEREGGSMTTDTPRTDAWECFSDPSYYDMARLRRTDGPKDFNTGYHLNNLREAIEVRDTLNELERRAEKAEAEVEELRGAILQAVNAFDKIPWGYDGDCGSGDIFSFLEDTLNPNDNPQ